MKILSKTIFEKQINARNSLAFFVMKRKICHIHISKLKFL